MLRNLRHRSGPLFSTKLARVLRALRALGLAASFVGCGPQGGTDVGNGVTVELDLQAYENAPAMKAQSLTLAGGARIDALWMVIDGIRLHPGSTCTGDDDGVDLEGPLVADLVGGGLLGGPASFKVPEGSFCGFRVGLHKLESAPPAGAPAGLAELSILVQGVRADGTSFTVRSDLRDKIELGATGGSFSLSAGKIPLILGYEVGAWITALDLDALPAQPIVIDEDNNDDRLDAFEDAVKASARLFRDEDENGDLSEAEHAEGSEIAD